MIQQIITIFLGVDYTILGWQSISRDAENNGSHPRRLDPTMELITYSFVLYLQNGRRDVKCKPSILGNESDVKAATVILFTYEIFWPTFWFLHLWCELSFKSGDLFQYIKMIPPLVSQLSGIT